MLGFLRRDAPGIAQVYFPGSAPPSLEAFGRLRDQRIEIQPLRPTEDGLLWAAKVRHPDWGEADLAFVRHAPEAADLVRFGQQPLARGEGRRARADDQRGAPRARPAQERARRPQDDAAVRAGGPG